MHIAVGYLSLSIARRGPVAGAFDVCTYCNTPLFAKVNNPEAYNTLFQIEKRVTIAVQTSQWLKS